MFTKTPPYREAFKFALQFDFFGKGSLPGTVNLLANFLVPGIIIIPNVNNSKRPRRYFYWGSKILIKMII